MLIGAKRHFISAAGHLIGAAGHLNGAAGLLIGAAGHLTGAAGHLIAFISTLEPKASSLYLIISSGPGLPGRKWERGVGGERMDGVGGGGWWGGGPIAGTP